MSINKSGPLRPRTRSSTTTSATTTMPARPALMPISSSVAPAFWSLSVRAKSRVGCHPPLGHELVVEAGELCTLIWPVVHPEL